MLARSKFSANYPFALQSGDRRRETGGLAQFEQLNLSRQAHRIQRRPFGLSHDAVLETGRGLRKTRRQGDQLFVGDECQKDRQSVIRYIQFVERPLFARDVHAELVRTEHGGVVRRGRRKRERAVRDTLRAMAQRFGIRIYDFASVGSHLHLLVRARRREHFQAFLREVGAVVVRVGATAAMTKKGRRVRRRRRRQPFEVIGATPADQIDDARFLCR